MEERSIRVFIPGYRKLFIKQLKLELGLPSWESSLGAASVVKEKVLLW